MSFTILEIIEQRSEFALAKVSHCDNTFEALVYNEPNIDSLIGKSILVELDYNKILSWRFINDFEDRDSGIWGDPQAIHLRGRIHNIIDLEEGGALVDVYLQSGPEFISIETSEVGEVKPEIGEGMEILIDKLRIYPNRV